MKKKIGLFVLLLAVLMLFSTFVTAQSSCDDYCSQNVAYFDGEYNARSGECNYDFKSCRNGCDDEGIACKKVTLWNRLFGSEDTSSEAINTRSVVVDSSEVEVRSRTSMTLDEEDMLTRDGGVANTLPEEDTDDQMPESDPRELIAFEEDEKDILFIEPNEPLDVIQVKKTYLTGVGVDALEELFAVGFEVRFEDGEQTYLVKLIFDEESVRLSSYDPETGEFEVYANLPNLYLIYDSYEEAISMHNFIRTQYKDTVHNSVEDYARMYIYFQTHDCKINKVLQEGDYLYDEDEKYTLQERLSYCNIDMRENTDDYFKVSTPFSYFYDQYGWDWQN